MKKVGLLCLAVVLALGTLGVGYAHWSDTVTITQTVDTGKVCIGFSKQGTGEPFGEVEDKDVGSISCELTGDIKGYVYYGSVLQPVYEGITVTMLNAYPCYQTYLLADVANCGTIPVRINPMVIEMVRVDEAGNVLETLTWVWTDHEGEDKAGHFVNAAGEIVLEMAIVNLEGSQLHPGEKNSVEFDMHVLQPIMQGSIYVMTIDINGIQWNLYGVP